MQKLIGTALLDAGLDFGDAGNVEFFYNVDRTLDYILLTINGDVYKKSFTYELGSVKTITDWIKQ